MKKYLGSCGFSEIWQTAGEFPGEGDRRGKLKAWAVPRQNWGEGRGGMIGASGTHGNAAGQCWAVLWDTGLGSRAYPAVVSRGTAAPVGLSGMGNPVPGFVEDITE